MSLVGGVVWGMVSVCAGSMRSTGGWWDCCRFLRGDFFRNRFRLIFLNCCIFRLCVAGDVVVGAELSLEMVLVVVVAMVGFDLVDLGLDVVVVDEVVVFLGAFFFLPSLCSGFMLKSGGHCSTRLANGFGGRGRLYASLYRSFH